MRMRSLRSKSSRQQSEAELYQDWSIPPLTQTIEEIKSEFFAEQNVSEACLNGKLVGSVRVSFNRGTCFVGRLIVHPAYRRVSKQT